MTRKYYSILAAMVAVIPGMGFSYSVSATIPSAVKHERCDVIIAGGSTAALAAALSSAREGARTCLIEPTDWAGGQLTAAGVPAVDFPWREDVQGVNTKAAMKDLRNNNYEFISWLKEIGNPGNCLVSRHCFLPAQLLNEKIIPAIAAEKNLRVFYQTVIKSVTKGNGKSGDKLTSLTAIARTAKTTGKYNGYERRLSQDISDWYDPNPSVNFDKQTIIFTGYDPKNTVFIEASEFGEVLALSDAPYLIAADKYEGSTGRQNTPCGQSMTLTYNVEYHDKPVAENAPPEESVLPDASDFNWGTYGWDNLWIYRRLQGEGAPGAGQISLMNWKQGNTNNGNDYANKYLFLSYKDTAQQVNSGQWVGGIDLRALDGAERLSYSFYYWFKKHAPSGLGSHINLSLSSTGTAYGLYKYPYLRESRRSVGYNDFLITTHDLDSYSGKTGYPYDDRVGITAYDYDIHPMDNCQKSYGFDPEDKSINPKPFFIPFRALTNAKYVNLVVAGKNMAQSFKAGSAIRLHPGEFASGTAAGVTAAFMVKHNLNNTHQFVDERRWKDIQPVIRKYQPLEWIIDNQRYPANGQVVPPVIGNPVCPANTTADQAKAWCFDNDTVYMAMTPEMVQVCKKNADNETCTRTFVDHAADGTALVLHHLPVALANKVRGNNICPLGTQPNPMLHGYCADSSAQKVYSLYSPQQWQQCLKAGSDCQSGLMNAATIK